MDKNSPLDSVRLMLAPLVAENAVFDGWTGAAVDAAAEQAEIKPEVARLAFPKDEAAMVTAWIDSIDRAMVAAFPPETIVAMKIRDRIRGLVWFRLEAAGPAREALRTGLSILSLPQNLPLAARTAWNSADLMWRLAGDTSTDYNHYTKRTILSGLYGATLYAWLDDDSEGWRDTAAFLDRRIDDVMQFEKFKAKWQPSPERQFSLSRFFGRLRYPPTG